MADVYDFGPDDPVDCAVLVCLASHANDDGKSCYPTLERVARMTRYSEKTVSRAVATLERGGWITIRRGRGRGNVSQYTISVSKLETGRIVTKYQSAWDGQKKGTESPVIDKEKGTESPLFDDRAATEKGTLATGKGDSDGNPPAPPNRRTVINRQKTLPLAAASGCENGVEARDAETPHSDPRHAPIRERVKWQQIAKIGSAIWDGRAAYALARLLRAQSVERWPLGRMIACVDNRFASDVNHAFHPATWLPRLTDYANGPLDRYGKPVGMRRRDGPSDAWMASRAPQSTEEEIRYLRLKQKQREFELTLEEETEFDGLAEKLGIVPRETAEAR